MTGLNTEVQYYQYALDLITDVFDLDCDDEMRETIEKSARHLYGLVHARFIVTTRGLAKMVSYIFSGIFLQLLFLLAPMENEKEDLGHLHLYYDGNTDAARSLKSTRRPTLENAPA